MARALYTPKPRGVSTIQPAPTPSKAGGPAKHSASPPQSPGPRAARAGGEPPPAPEASAARTRYYASDPARVGLSVSAVVWRGAPRGALLLMRRSDNGLWGLPGGYVERGESVAEAAAREVREETGAHVHVGRLLGVYSDPAVQVIAYPDGERVQAVNLCFEAQLLAEGAATTPEESLETGYFPPGALPSPRVPIHEVRIRDALEGASGVAVR